MNRRELLKMIAALTGVAVIGSEFLLEGCKNPSAKSTLTFSDDNIAFLDEVAEIILPATDSPGAKEAKVGQFMTVAVNDCYGEEDQKIFHDGMQKLNEACKNRYHERFMNVTPENRHDFLVSLDKEAKEYQKKKDDFDKVQHEKESEEWAKGNDQFKKETMPSHYFTMMKQLTLWDTLHLKKELCRH